MASINVPAILWRPDALHHLFNEELLGGRASHDVHQRAVEVEDGRPGVDVVLVVVAEGPRVAAERAAVRLHCAVILRVDPLGHLYRGYKRSGRAETITHEADRGQ